MICSECSDRLLEMESAAIARVLSGSGVSESSGGPDARVAAHLQACRECRAAAERIVAAEDDLREGLAALGPASSAAQAAREARIESHRRRVRVRSRVGWVVAAAGLAGVLGVRMVATSGQPGSAREDEAPLLRVASAAPSNSLPEVEAKEDENVMIFETEDGDVVVFWFYEGRER
jgi:hypothetical protein